MAKATERREPGRVEDNEVRDPATEVAAADGPRDEVLVHLVSLGCPKNLVDSEMILGQLASRGFAVTADSGAADILIVNTCGFIDSAKEESINTILEACEIKRRSPTPKKVVVAGCLGQRYGHELRDEIPELDAIVGLGEYQELGGTLLDLVRREAPGAGGEPALHFQVSDPTKACNAEVGRFRLTPTHYAYVRISEGCDNPCTFCAIPAIRGRFRSKPIEMVVEEAEELAANGAKELVLISQDSTSYGVDLDGTFQLDRLLERLDGVRGIEWIRLLYAYPAYMTDAMIDAVASLPKVVKYVDMPLQHITNTMLRRMGRRLNEAKTRALIERMRERIPGLYLRTTFIVGFPGESAEDFAALERFVTEARFERLGVFPYSPEEGTPSASFADHVPVDVSKERLDSIMRAQQEVAFAHNRRRRGETTKVLIDAVTEGKDGRLTARGRSAGEAPEIDPSILLRLDAGRRDRIDRGAGAKGRFIEIPAAPSSAALKTAAAPETSLPRPGDILEARIVSSRGYDLIAEPLGACSEGAPR